MGYHRAGFDVVGVDLEPQPHYPFEFHQADAMAFPLDGFDAIHASPPCQRWIAWQNIGKARGGTNDWPDLVTPTRARLASSGLPYVIENGPNTPLLEPLTLCGSVFGLGVHRHRKFESNVLVMHPGPCRHSGSEVGVYGKLDGRRLYTRADGSELRNPSSLAQASEAMGIGWMTWDELREAVPPAYTEWIGAQLLEALECAA